MSGRKITEHAAKLVGRLTKATEEKAASMWKFKGAEDSLRAQRKAAAHRQQFGAHYWKLRNYIEFLEANVSASALEAAQSLPSKSQGGALDV